ncbi:TonB-dependent receptor [Luteitalea sp.]|uniref:TonB-dependent receptor domain-containing protein n=1 Tax=Luteitalea sp. TaxID=2004800 RepID=UPI0025C19CDD|nr:TonB-dependent receptor [Luteitalea sp.]
MERISRLAVAWAMAASVLLGTAHAQSAVGALAGTARDGSGSVVPGVTVVLVNEGTNDTRETTTEANGSFAFRQIEVGVYTARLSLTGFKTQTYTGIRVSPGQEYSLAAVLAVGDLAESVEVTAGVDLVNTTSTEVSTTVLERQIKDLPLNGRNPIELIRLQAGVPGTAVRQNTAINGGRPSWTQVTQDGVNIQDNFIRVNGLDFVPNRPTSDTVAEFSIVTNTQGADSAGGSSQVRLVTPSGTNNFRGGAYVFNRNSALGANRYFNNRDGIEKPYLNRNQIGGTFGGPVFRNRLFFFGYYEAFRQENEATPNNRIPRNADFADGVFRYRDLSGTQRSVNVLGLSGLPLDARVRSELTSRFAAPSNVNNSDLGDGLNTGGYRFNQTDLNNRDQFGMRFDYTLNSNNRFEFIYTRFKETDDRTDLDTISARPLTYTESTTDFVVGAWRWTPTSRLQNELRIGANLAPVGFYNDQEFSDTIFNMPSIGGALTNPVVTFQPQGRDTRTRQFVDSASLAAGNHTLQFGGSLQQIRVQPYNFAGRFPTATFGFSAGAPAGTQLTTAQFPGGISAQDLASANAQLAFLGGVISQVSQTFQVADRESGYVPGLANVRDFSLDNYAVFLQDSWRIRPNVTIRAGLKWEYYSPLREDNNLALLPVNTGTPIETTLNPAGTVDFVDGGFYKADRNNFAPSVGVVWDPFSDGKTSVRAAYSMAVVNEETITVARNAAVGNAGLDSTLARTNLYAFAGQGVPQVAAPAFRVPRTYLDQLALSPTSAAFTVDPDIRQPRVHQLTFGVEREIGWNTAVEARYVGTLGRDIWTGLDYNQINVPEAFLQDFLRARSNGFAAQAAGLPFNPTFNATVAGSQPLTVLPTFGVALTNATVISNIQTGAVASLADFYVTNRIAGAAQAFLPNPNIYAADVILSNARTDYHALQLEARRRMSRGVLAQVNYTYSKALASSPGTTQARFEPLLDNNRPELERTRAEFHVSHVLNSNVIWELPVGEGRRFLNRGGVLNAVLGGWQLANILRWQSGAPISLLAPRGTFNRGGRSAGNMAVTSLSRDEIADLLGIQTAADGTVYYISPSVIDPATGRAVGPDNVTNTASFNGQVFFNPSAGQLGTLQRLSLDGPPVLSWDASLSKRSTFGSHYGIEVRGDFFNVTNSAIFFVGDYDINSTTFGRVTGLAVGPRVTQLAVKFTF